MDYKAYHNALSLGYSESEATRIGEDAFIDSLATRNKCESAHCQPTPLCDICGESAAVAVTNDYFVCSEQCNTEAILRQGKQ